MTPPVSTHIPPTPMKAKRLGPMSPEERGMNRWAKKAKAEPSAYETLFKTVTESKNVNLYGVDAHLELLGKGYFMYAFTVQTDTEILPDVANNSLIFKIYHGAKNVFNAQTLANYTKRSVENYHQALQCGLPVATFHNVETALEDKYFLVERIPLEISMPRDVEKVHHFFMTAFANKVYFDLHPSNLRVRDDGTVTLIDFVEEEIKFKTTPGSECACRITALLTAWAEHGKTFAEGKEIVSKLTAGLEPHGFNPMWAQDALRTAFPYETI